MFCEKCGAVLADGAKFCEKCGAPVQPVPGNPPAREQAPIPPENPPAAPSESAPSVPPTDFPENTPTVSPAASPTGSPEIPPTVPPAGPQVPPSGNPGTVPQTGFGFAPTPGCPAFPPLPPRKRRVPWINFSKTNGTFSSASARRRSCSSPSSLLSSSPYSRKPSG